MTRKRRSGDASTLRDRLLRWYRENRRDLPWRGTGDPYAIWVSEVMLQQTRVETVLPFYRRFLERFPDVAALARASDDEVLSLWSGLGYYRRARALRDGALAVMERHDGRVPDDPRELQALPGVGRYTAGAISSIAFDREEAILDGNVRRVLSRLFAVGAPAARAERRLWELAGELVRGPRPGDLNQALMELGATVCRPRDPICATCPAGGDCRALALEQIERYPPPRPRPEIVAVRVGVAAVFRAGRVLLERPTQASPLRGTWDLPAIELGPTAPATRALATGLARRHRLEVSVGEAAGSAPHAIMNRRLRLEVHRASLVRGRVAGRVDLRWIAPSELDEVPVSGATRKALGVLAAHQTSHGGRARSRSDSGGAESSSIGARSR
ncbi:MAG: A/G-specific adenine glycosylase [bacterium]|nr:A/G-specific adenine glycosylase [bacterium]